MLGILLCRGSWVKIGMLVDGEVDADMDILKCNGRPRSWEIISRGMNHESVQRMVGIFAQMQDVNTSR